MGQAADGEQFTTFADSPPIKLSLLAPHVKLASVTEGAIASIIVGGAISQTEVDTKLIPGMREGLEAAVMQDCTMLSNPPTCGCPESSSAKTYIGLFDTNNNCDISVDELRNNSLIQSLLAPDLSINGVAGLSIGFGATAVHAAFSPPGN